MDCHSHRSISNMEFKFNSDYTDLKNLNHGYFKETS